jgi:aminopeptidase N
MKNTVLFLLVFFSGTVLSQPSSPPEHLTRERTYHVLHYKLVLSVDVRKKECRGDAIISLVPLRPQFDTLQLDAASMDIQRITMRDIPLESSLTGETLSIALGRPYGLTDTLTVDVKYSVTSPKKGLYFVQPDSGYPEKQWQAWTQGEAIDNHFWFPCYDAPNDLSTSETIITVDDHLTVVSNGSLLGRSADAKHHQATYHWYESKPHVSYLVSLAVGTYIDVADSSGSLPIDNYVYPFQEEDAMRSFGNTPRMIDFFSKKIGYPFPWEKYGHALVEDFMFSGEENVSISTITDRTIHDARAHLDYSSEPLVAHELAHQWWGDLVSFRDWSHAWLSEGFATYFEMLYEEHAHGHDAAAKVLHDAQQVVVNSDRFDSRRPTVCNRYTNPIELFDNRIYQKGACVLHMLRFFLGDELFWKSIDHYVHKFAFHNVETNDLKVAIEEATGYNLQWFLDEWLYHAGYPEFLVQTSWDKNTRAVTVTVKQQQRVDSLTPIFRMPVDIEVWVHGEPETYRVEITRQQESFSFPAYQQPQLVIFDKGGQLLKRATFYKTREEWLYQLQHAEEGIDRLAAIDELQWTIDSTAVRGVMENVMMNDTFPQVRRDAIWAIGDVKSVDESDYLSKAYGDGESSVRAASVTSLGRYRGDKIVAILRHAFDKDSSDVVAAAALRSLTTADSVHRKEYLKEGLRRDSYNENIRSTALQCFTDIGDEEALDTVVSYTRYGLDRNIRVQAIRSLGAVWGSREDVTQYLFRFLSDPSYFVRRSAIDVLGKIENERVVNRLHQFIATESDGRLVKAAKDAVEKIEDSLKKKNSH